MLPSNYRITVKNETGAVSAGAVSVKIKRWKINADLTVTYDIEATVFNAATIAAGTHDQGNATAQNNAGNWQGFDWVISAANGTSTGNYSMWLEVSTDGAATWPTAGESEQLDVINVAVSTTERRSGSY